MVHPDPSEEDHKPPLTLYVVRLHKHQVFVLSRSMVVEEGVAIFHSDEVIDYMCATDCLVEVQPATPNETRQLHIDMSKNPDDYPVRMHELFKEQVKEYKARYQVIQQNVDGQTAVIPAVQ